MVLRYIRIQTVQTVIESGSELLHNTQGGGTAFLWIGAEPHLE